VRLSFWQLFLEHWATDFGRFWFKDKLEYISGKIKLQSGGSKVGQESGTVERSLHFAERLGGGRGLKSNRDAQVRVRIGVLDGGEAGLGSRLSCPHKQTCQQVRITVLLHKANKKGPAEVGKC